MVRHTLCGKAVKMRSGVFSILLWATLLAASQADAAGVEARERAAKKACLTGDEAKGVEILADLYIDTDDPTYLYNQGRCFEQNNRYEDAVGKFREYLRKAGSASADEKADAEKHIADCEALIAKKEPEAVQPILPKPEPRRPEARIEPEPPPPIPPGPKAKEPTAEVGEHANSPAGGGSGLRVAGIVTLSVGAAALIGGLVTNLQYNGKVGDLQKSYDPKVNDSAQTYHTLSVAAYGVGAACMVGGAILYYLGWREGRAALVPVTVAGGGGAALTGAF